MRDEDIDRIVAWIKSEGHEGKGLKVILTELGFKNRQIGIFLTRIFDEEENRKILGTGLEVFQSIDEFLEDAKKRFFLTRKEQGELRDVQGIAKDDHITSLGKKHVFFPTDDPITTRKEFNEEFSKVKGRNANITELSETIITTNQRLGKNQKEISFILARNELLDKGVNPRWTGFKGKVKARARTYRDVITQFEKERT